MTPQLIYNHSIEDSDIHNLCEDLVQYSDIAPKYYERFDVKRGQCRWFGRHCWDYPDLYGTRLCNERG